MEQVDLIVYNTSQLLTMPSQDGGPQRRAVMGNLGAVANGAVAIQDGLIVAVGDSADILAAYSAERTIDAQGNAVIPGLIDCHTHAIYGGDRAHEFEMRIQGATYMDIMAAGGGIVSTMQNTRDADEDELAAAAQKRLDEMLHLGTTTVEIKSGYGLNLATELKMMRVMERLNSVVSAEIVPTFLGAHTVPPEYKGNADGYVDLVVDEMIPAVTDWFAQSQFAADGSPLFIDVFCEDHAFDIAQTKRILRAGQAAGMGVKIHVDQFNALGGLPLALELGATSADHLEVTRGAAIGRIAASNTVAVLLPAVNFNLGLTEFAAGRALIDAGAAVALATDLNPGSAPCLSLPFVMGVACRYMRLTPAEALAACTINAAYALNVGDRLGSLEPGKQADLLILDSADYRHLAYQIGGNRVQTVVKRGQIV
ncbi:MAG: imidazolonepropionase [Anaerolineae bacterium]|nr:imidazolonepropionase [Anaerolineae bacterium]